MRTYQLNVITLDGDKVDRKGAMTGGFHDVRRSRLQAAEQLHRWTTAHNTESTRLSEVVRNRQQLDQEITQLEGKLTIAQTKLRQLEGGREPMLQQVSTLREDVSTSESRLQRMENVVQAIETDLNSSKTQLEAYQVELGQPMEQSLSHSELDALVELSKTMEQSKTKLAEVSKQYNTVRNKKSREGLSLSILTEASLSAA